MGQIRLGKVDFFCFFDGKNRVYKRMNEQAISTWLSAIDFIDYSM